MKSFAVVAVVIVLFFLSGVIPNFRGLGVCSYACQPHVIRMHISSWCNYPGWIAIFGAVILIVLSGIKDLIEVMHKIGWSTVLFVAGLFIMMKVRY